MSRPATKLGYCRMTSTYDLAIIGGGPAGCAAAITAARAGLGTILFERGHYPRHKVCGEFISFESHQLLEDLLGRDSHLLQTSPTISRARMFSERSFVEFELPSHAWSITRHDLDFALWNAAVASNVDCQQSATVESICQTDREFKLVWSGHSCPPATITARSVINAAGRWSNLHRPTEVSTPRWIGIKAHFSGEQAPASTDIYFFQGGYCGVQPIANGQVNASAMVRSDVATSIEQVFAAHPDLWRRSRNWDTTTDVITTSPLIHAAPVPVTNGVLNAGDAAGFIDPFLGDGISLALRTGVLAAQYAGDPECYEKEYQRRFGRAFQTAALARRITRGPESIRRLAAFGFRSAPLRKWALQLTRGVA